MASNADATRATLEQLFEAQWDATSAPLFWIGRNFDPPDSGPWLELALLFGDAFEDVMGPTGIGGNVAVGVLKINVFGTDGVGFGDLYRLADSARDIVNRKTVNGVRLGAPSFPARVPNDQHAQVVVNCPIEFDETI